MMSLSDKAMQDLWIEGHNDGFKSAVEGYDHPEIGEEPEFFDAAFTSGYFYGRAWKMAFELGEEIGPNGLCDGDEEDLETYRNLFTDGFEQGREFNRFDGANARERAFEHGNKAGFIFGDAAYEAAQATFEVADEATKARIVTEMNAAIAAGREADVCARRYPEKSCGWEPLFNERMITPLTPAEYIAEYQRGFSMSFTICYEG